MTVRGRNLLRAIVGVVVAALVVSVATPAGASTAPWTVDTVLTPPFDVGAYTDVSCPTAGFCMAVGGSPASTDLPGVAARWDGTVWTALPLPRGGNVVDLAGVACLSAQFCLAVGSDTRSRPAVQRWDGSVWSDERAPVPSTGAPGQLDGVDCVTPVDCTAVGAGHVRSTERAFVAHWDGRTWSTQPVARLSSATYGSALSAVTCASSNRCFAVGHNGYQQLLLTSRNQVWTMTPLPGAGTDAGRGELRGVSCGSATACFAVGAVDHGGGPTDPTPAVFGWTGGAWSVVPTPDPGLSPATRLYDISCTGPTTCEAVGGNSPPGHFDLRSYAQRLDGATWTVSPFAPPATGSSYDVHAVDCTASACVSVGSYAAAAPEGRSTMAQVDEGGGWRVVATPNAVRSSHVLLDAVSCPSDDDCVAVGKRYGAQGPLPAVERWNGVRWSWSTPDLPFLPTLLSCGSPGHCLTVGTAALQVESRLSALLSGGTWTTMPIARPAVTGRIELTGLSCASAGSCLLVGADFAGGHSNPLIESWTPAAGWRIVPAPTPSSGGELRLGDVSCVRVTWCLVVGSQIAAQSDGFAVIWNGTRWRETSVPVQSDGQALRRVSCASTTVCAAIGTEPGRADDVVQWDGAAWHQVPEVAGAPPGAFLGAVSCGTDTSCTAVGRPPFSGVSFSQSWDGVAWTADTTQPPDTTSPHGISCHAVCHVVSNSEPIAISRPVA